MDMNKDNNMPDGWVETTLGEVGSIITGKTPSKNHPEDWGDIVDFVTPSDIKNDSKYISICPRKLSISGEARSARMILPSNSVIVTCIGSDMGKVIINRDKALTNQQINSLTYENHLFRNRDITRNTGRCMSL